MNKYYLTFAASLAMLVTGSISAAVGDDSDASKKSYLQVGALNTDLLSAIDIKATQTQAQQTVSQIQTELTKQKADNQKYLQQVGQQIIQAGTRGGGMTPVSAPAQNTANQPSSSTPAAATAPAAISTPQSASPAQTPQKPTSGSNSGNNGSSNTWNYGF